jgi:hypothetical protein
MSETKTPYNAGGRTVPASSLLPTDPVERMTTQRCLHEDCKLLAPMQAYHGPEGRHTTLMLLGCRDCGIGVPFPEYNFALLRADEQQDLVALAQKPGFAWDATRYPLNPERLTNGRSGAPH